MKQTAIRLAAAAVVIFAVALFSNVLLPEETRAQISIAVSQLISEQTASYGDIVAYDRQNGIYHLPREENASNLYGVIAQQPMLVFQSGTNTVPVLRSGRTLVNVTLENGPIARGDFITSSPTPGKGQRADADQINVIGTAAEPFNESAGVATTTASGEEIIIGTIAVDVDIEGAPVAAAEEQTEKGVGGFSEATIINIIQYIVAAFIAVGSVYIAFRNFMPNINRGIISVGRNPRARSSIQSMVLFNAFLIVIISAAGFFVAIGIILLPL